MFLKLHPSRKLQFAAALLLVLILFVKWAVLPTATNSGPEKISKHASTASTAARIRSVEPEGYTTSSSNSPSYPVANAFLPEESLEVPNRQPRAMAQNDFLPIQQPDLQENQSDRIPTQSKHPSYDTVDSVLNSTPSFDFGKRRPAMANSTSADFAMVADDDNIKPNELKVPPSSSQAHLNRDDFHDLPPVDLQGKDIDSIAAFTSDDEVVMHDSAVSNTTLTQPLPAQAPSASTQGTTDYILAEQPKIGDHYKAEMPVFDPCACEVTACLDDFSPDPIDQYQPYDPYLNQQVYEGKQLFATQRPLLELGTPWYQLGQLSPGYSFLGEHNNVNPQFLIFGDYRQAIASNTVNGDNVSQYATELNTFGSLFITGTERLVAGVSPLDNGVQNSRWLFDEDRLDIETDFDFDFGYLEGDLGAITGGLIGETLPFDLPFAAGLTPIFIQNGIWINDALEGLFFTMPARNSPRFNISNMDITFAYIYDQINSAAFQGDNSAAKAYAFFFFLEALNGYIEADYAFLEDRSVLDRSYHNIGLAYTRRFGRFISHSTRVIANAGQDVTAGDQTADGVLLLSENSLITRNPYSVIPYFNFFAGFDTPQSFAGDQELVNTGILFESDGMTGYPTLDGRAQDSFGYGIGLNLLAADFSQQLILETAAVFRNDDSDLAGDQYGIGMRYQLPLNNSWIFRTDSMYGFFRNDSDDFGMRMELRKKF